MIASVSAALSLFASTAMFAVTAVALAFGLGVRRLPLGRVPLLFACVVTYSACALAVEATSSPSLGYLVSLGLLFGASATFALVFVCGPVLVRLVTVVSCVFSMIAARSVITNVFSLYLNELFPGSDVATLAFFVSLYGACAGLAVFFVRFPLRPAALLPAPYWAALLAVPVATAVLQQAQTLFYVQDAAASPAPSLIPLLALISIVSSYAMTHVISGAYDSLMEQNAVNQQLALTLDHVRRSATIAEQVRRDKHEMKNILFYLQSLARAGLHDELEDFLEVEVSEHFAKLEEFHTGNELLDYLLTQKVGEAREAGIKTCFDVVVPAGLSIEGRDLCGLLSNLLDNAVEASAAEKDPEIRLTMRASRGYLSIMVSNRCSTDVMRTNPHLHTTKGNAAEHGIGLRVVRSIAKKYEGSFSTEMVDGKFVATALLGL
ncbi:MAG TPA: GHKL domain-containing protein [Candidatus Olsenella pullicola]|nr:GHKL domain-containing protein [Candidatus Olsenella pullicola]